MEELIDKLLPLAIEAGIRSSEFFSMTLEEIEMILKSYAKKEKEREREEAGRLYMLASLIVKGTGIYHGNKYRYPKFYDLFPMFKDEETDPLKKEEQIKEESWKKDQRSMISIAEYFNKRNRLKREQESSGKEGETT